MPKAKKRGVMQEDWHLPDLRRQVDPYTLAHAPVGSYPNVEERAMLKLARAIHQAESDGAAVSWSAQQRASAYINANGLAAALDEAFRLEGA